jgi:hypothetical protein
VNRELPGASEAHRAKAGLPCRSLKSEGGPAVPKLEKRRRVNPEFIFHKNPLIFKFIGVIFSSIIAAQIFSDMDQEKVKAFTLNHKPSARRNLGEGGSGEAG